MKTDFLRLAAVAGCALFFAACGQAERIDAGFEASSATCSANAMPTQFIVRHTDDSIEVIHAESEEAFKSGYMKDNAATIRYAEHDYQVKSSETTVHATDIPPVTGTSADNWGPVKISAAQMWAQNIYGNGVIVAVVDSGMDFTHPQLQPVVYTNPGESGTDSQGRNKATNGLDDDSNGYIDDAVGYDFYANKPLAGDYQYHGTHVSGIVAAYHHDVVAQPEPYVQGVAPGVRVMPLAFLHTADGEGSMSDAVRAIQYAVKQGARVINASWGGTQCSAALKEEINSLASKNVVFVTASGNDSANIDKVFEYPASLNLAAQITVGATDDQDFMGQYSNYGVESVHIFAPGTDIFSTLPNGTAGYLTGTSMATPFVSGAVALLLSAVPQATVAQIRAALYVSAMHNQTYLNASLGRLDMTSALAQLRALVAH